MDIKSIEIQDTSGTLSDPIWRTGSTPTATTAWFSEDTSKSRQLSVAPMAIKFGHVINKAEKYTQLSYLAYNGTNSTSTRTFRNVVASSSTVFDYKTLPILTYSPNGLEVPDYDDLDDVVIDIKLHTGQADILEYREGSLSRSGKSYNIKAVHSYPATITTLPNVEYNKVYLDGWYTYDFIMYRDIVSGITKLTEGVYYAYRGYVFKASVEGYFIAVDTGEGTYSLYIVANKPTVETETQSVSRTQQSWIPLNDDVQMSSDEETVLVASGATKQTIDIDYLDVIMNLKNSDGVGEAFNHAYVESQLLITDEIRDAITEELICEVMCNDDVGTTFTPWQKLTTKRNAAAVMFYNELFRNAQVIIESSRKLCNVKKCSNGN